MDSRDVDVDLFLSYHKRNLSFSFQPPVLGGTAGVTVKIGPIFALFALIFKFA
jgi:hypothetical protein